MTIATNKGFEVGGIYVAKEGSCWFTEGSLVILEDDDGTDRPFFKLLQGEPHIDDAQGGKLGAYESLCKFRPPTFSEFVQGRFLLLSGETQTQEGEENTKTPLQLKGLSEGDILSLSENTCIEAGPLVEIEEDGTTVLFVRVLTGNTNLGHWLPIEVMSHITPAKCAGLAVGDRVKVITKSYGGALRFRNEVSVGDILTFSKDDGTDTPIFTTESGRIICPKIGNVVKLEEDDTMIGNGKKVAANSEGHHIRGKGNSGELIEVGGFVEEGDILILKSGQTVVVGFGGYPDSDGDYDTEERFINKSEVEAIYRRAESKKEPEEDKVEVTIKISLAARSKLALTGFLSGEHETFEDYSDEYKKAVAEVVNAVSRSRP